MAGIDKGELVSGGKERLQRASSIWNNGLSGAEKKRRRIYVRFLYVLILGSVLPAIFVFLRGLGREVKIVNLAAFEFFGLSFPVGLRFDFISNVLLAMVTVLGAAIAHYALRYLDGEKRQVYFYHYLILTLLSVSFMVCANDLAMVFIFWTGTSACLHQLLVYYPHRPQARAAARKKFFISRLGDVFVLSAIAMTYREFGTLQFDQIFAVIEDLSARTAPDFESWSMIGMLFAMGAMTKSVQLPFHFWLPETMETPTPVSALMHAGVINAGGFLMIRLSPLLEQAMAAHILLTLLGAATAVFGVLVMITQNDIKKKLAYSTISQMGMMLFACGLGAYVLALFHIVAHSFYKAHAFLSTGELVRESKKVGFRIQPMSIRWLVGVSCVGVTTLWLAAKFAQGRYLADTTYALVLFLGLAQSLGAVFVGAYSPARVIGIVILRLIGALAMVSLVDYLIHLQVLGIIPDGNSAWSDRWAGLAVSTLAYFIFVFGVWMSSMLMSSKSALMQKLYVFFWNGGYFSARSGRLAIHWGGAQNRTDPKLMQPLHIDAAEQSHAK